MFVKHFLASHYPQIPLSDLHEGPQFITFSAKTFVHSHKYFTTKAIILFVGDAYITVPRNPEIELSLTNMVKVRKYKQGEILNRIELQHRGSCLEYVLVQSQTIVLVIEESVYRTYIASNILKDKTISNFPLLKNLPRKYLSLIELNSQTISEKRNKKLFSQGDPVDFCYFSLEGQVSVILQKQQQSKQQKNPKRGKSPQKQQLIIQAGEYFGFQHKELRGYDARVYSTEAVFARVHLFLLLYVCWCNNIELQTIRRQRMRILKGLSNLQNHTSRNSFIVEQAPPNKIRVQQDFFLEKPSKNKPLFYLNSIKSKPNLHRSTDATPRLQATSKTIEPTPRNSIKQTLFQFNVAKYDYKIKNQKLFHILRLIKQKTQQMHYTQQDIWDLQKMARSHLTLYEMQRMYEQLLSPDGLDDLMAAVKLKRRYKVRFETPRTVRQSKQSPSISQLKADMRQKLKGQLSGRKCK